MNPIIWLPIGLFVLALAGLVIGSIKLTPTERDTVATFNTPYEDHDPRNGQTVEVLGEFVTASHHLVAVRFPDGYVTEVWPEEIGAPIPSDPEDYI